MMIIKLKTAVQDIADASILLALLMFVYILLGMQVRSALFAKVTHA